MARAVAAAGCAGDGEATLNSPGPVAGSANARFPLIPPRLWAEIAACRTRLLVLDYDGTLAPLRTKRFEARLPARVRAALERLVASGRSQVAIVSGRSLDELCALTAGLDIHRVAEHGWDELPPGGEPLRRELPARAGRAMSLADDEARASGWTPHVERKRCSRVLHTRGLEPAAAEALQSSVGAAWRALAARHGLVVRDMDGGLELRVPDVDKGTAVSAMIARCAPGTCVAYIGDDDTDEDAFRSVAPVGWAIRVGATERPSRANARLESVEDMGDFLVHWEVVTSAAGSIAAAPDTR